MAPVARLDGKAQIFVRILLLSSLVRWLNNRSVRRYAPSKKLKMCLYWFQKNVFTENKPKPILNPINCDPSSTSNQIHCDRRMLGPEAIKRLLHDVNDRYELTEGRTWTQMCWDKGLWVAAEDQDAYMAIYHPGRPQNEAEWEARFEDAQNRNYRLMDMHLLQNEVASIVDENAVYETVFHALEPLLCSDLISKVWHSIEEICRNEDDESLRLQFEAFNPDTFDPDMDVYPSVTSSFYDWQQNVLYGCHN